MTIELRKNWFEEKWLNVAMNDVHPTCDDTWYPQPFDKYELPKIMHTHPYFNFGVN